MYSYIKGKVVETESNYIVVDNNGIGYQIFVSNPFSFKLEEIYKLFLYDYLREDEHSLYGFKTIEEKKIFLKLINVKGLGPKMIMPMFITGTVDGIIDAIDRENILYLTKFPKIGDKIARQIILDLKGKIDLDNINEKNSNNFSELIEALESLGYKNSNIKKIIPNIKSEKLEDQIREALKLL